MIVVQMMTINSVNTGMHAMSVTSAAKRLKYRIATTTPSFNFSLTSTP